MKKFNLKGTRTWKFLALAAVVAMALMLTGCYIPPDEISGNTENITIGSNNLPFQTLAPSTPPTPTPTPYTAPEKLPGSQPTVNWDDWGTGSTPAPQGTAGVPTTVPGPGSITVVTQQPTATPAPTSLRHGAEGKDVRALQQRLKDLGYLTGRVDGDYGDATEEAVRHFQAAHKLTVDGVAGKKTQELLFSDNAIPASESNVTIATRTPKPTNTPKIDTNTYLQVGSSGTKVRTLQNRLIALGWMAGKADGDFGGATEAAVKAFQKKMGLWNDGVAGPDTLQKLYGSSAKKTSTPVSSVGETLEDGSKGDAVRALQRRLKELDFYTGSIDGDYGAGTKNAVIAFQKQHRLTADGRAGTSTLNKIYSTGAQHANEEPSSGNSGSSSGNNTSGDEVSSTGYKTLREGDYGDSVRKLQKKLKELGYYSGSADGKYGAGTTKAVIEFQKAKKLRADGVAGPQTQRALYNTSTSITYATLRKGDRGSAVTNLQYTLYELGYYDGEVDGVYGDTTADAVRAFQIQNNIKPVDGIAGNKTQQKLYSSSALSATNSGGVQYKTLREGDIGDGVVRLQDTLQELGYLEEVTGIYDKKTTSAVKAFQKRNGLSPVDGVAGPATQKKLYSNSAKPNN